MEESKESVLGELIAEMNLALQEIEVGKVCATIGSAIKLQNASDIARKAGIERPSVYRSFGPTGSPNFTTAVRVLDAMGLRLKILPRQKTQQRRRRPAKREQRVVGQLQERIAD
jgi:probable addiction module antidote protein